MSVVSGVVGAITGSNASSDAADAGAAASKYATDLQRDMYDQNREDMMPFLEHAESMLQFDESANAHADAMRSGHRDAQSAFQDLWSEGPGSYEESDYYKDTQASIDYAIEKAQKEMDLKSTGTGSMYGRKLTDYSMDTAAELTRQGRGNFINEWINTRLNPLQQNINSLAGHAAATNPAMNVVPAMSNANANAASGMANTILAGGAAEAGGILGGQQALMQGLQGGSTAAALGINALLNKGGAANIAKVPARNFDYLNA